MTTPNTPAEASEALAELASAQTLFHENGDLAALIATYESVLKDTKLDLDDARLELARLYVQAGNTGAVWDYTNRLCMTHPHLRAQVRLIQCDVFVNAQRWMDALTVLMQHHLLAFKNTDKLDRDGFVSRATELAGNLGWGAERVEEFARILDRYVETHNVDESLLRREVVQECMQFLAADERRGQ